jgi:hypothetical protein
MHDEEFNDLYPPPNTIRMMKSKRMQGTGNKACTGRKKNLYSVLNEKNRMKKVTCRLEDNIKIDLKEIKWEVVDWICLGWDRCQWWVA